MVVLFFYAGEIHVFFSFSELLIQLAVDPSYQIISAFNSAENFNRAIREKLWRKYTCTVVNNHDHYSYMYIF